MLNNLQHFYISGAHVYLARFDENVEVKPVSPAIRQQVIDKCGDGIHKQQRYCVWQLLDYALRAQVGKGVDGLSFAVEDNGKWSCNDGVHFSLSHSGNVVAVAVSTEPVGIDVEIVDEQRFNSRLASRILMENERKTYDKVQFEEQPRVLAEFWTKKESIFKRDGGMSFAPNKIDTTVNSVSSTSVAFGEDVFVVSIATCK